MDMNEEEIRRELQSISNPSEDELVEERAKVSQNNRFNLNFLLSLAAFAALAWILSGMPGA